MFGINNPVQQPSGLMSILQMSSIAVYKLVYDEKAKIFKTEFRFDRFKTPNRLFGELNDYYSFYRKTLANNQFNTSYLFLGQKGAGKTLLLELLANNCIDAGMTVITVNISNMDRNKLIALISFMEKSNNICFLFDEFGKNIDIGQQSKLLTVFNRTIGDKRVILLSENESNRVSSLIRSRPGRVKYRKIFKKLTKRTMEEYCRSFNVSEKTINELQLLTAAVEIFTFDHLSNIVVEHLKYPEMPLVDLVDLMNVDLEVVDEYRLVSIYRGDEKLKDSALPSYYHTFAVDRLRFQSFSIEVKNKDVEEETPPKDGVGGNSFGGIGGRNNSNYTSISFTNSDAISIDGDILVYEKDGVTVTYTKESLYKSKFDF